jgi:hypothetical protein
MDWIKRWEDLAMSEKQRDEIIEREAPRISNDNFHRVDNRSLALDVLKTVREITLFTDATDDKSAIRSMYHRTHKSNTIPTFKWGSLTCARRSSIRAVIWMQESRAWQGALQEDLMRVHILLSSILASLAENEHSMNGHDRALTPLMAEVAKTIQRVLQGGGA